MCQEWVARFFDHPVVFVGALKSTVCCPHQPLLFLLCLHQRSTPEEGSCLFDYIIITVTELFRVEDVTCYTG
jgi:hypothetical protein